VLTRPHFYERRDFGANVDAFPSETIFLTVQMWPCGPWVVHPRIQSLFSRCDINAHSWGEPCVASFPLSPTKWEVSTHLNESMLGDLSGCHVASGSRAPLDSTASNG